MNLVPRDADSIELKGNLLLIYKRNREHQNRIENLNVVFKGYWKEKQPGQAPQTHDFIYKKNWHLQQTRPELTYKPIQMSSNEELLRELFITPENFDQEVIDPTIGLEQRGIVNLHDYQLMLTKLFQSQG